MKRESFIVHTLVLMVLYMCVKHVCVEQQSSGNDDCAVLLYKITCIQINIVWNKH